MKNKKSSLSYILIVLFVAMLVLPHLGSAFWGNSTDTVNRENRNKAPFPDEFKWKKIPIKLEEYYNDRVPFRDMLLDSSAWLHDYLFPFSLGEVVIGKDNFLFYAPGGDRENSLTQYAGLDKPRKYELECAVDYFLWINRVLKEREIPLVYFIPPNKVDIYPEKLPERRALSFSESGWPEQMQKAMSEQANDVNYLYPKNTLLAAKILSKENLYYPGDTHWNKLGAYVGTIDLLKRAGGALPDNWPEFSALKLKYSTDFEENDLWRVLGKEPPEGVLGNKFEFENFPNYPIEYDYIDQEQYFISRNSQSPDPRKVIIFRDSFCISMVPFLASYFNEVHYVWSDFSLAKVDELKPDLVIVERISRALYGYSRRSYQKKMRR